MYFIKFHISFAYSVYIKIFYNDDYKLLKELMERAGFKNVKECQVGKSDDVNLQNLEAHGKFIGEEIAKLQTFVVEGTK